MERAIREKFIEQLDALASKWSRLVEITLRKPRYDYIDIAVIYEFLTLAKSTIEQIAGKNSRYAKEVASIEAGDYLDPKIAPIAGIVTALRSALQADFLETASELIHGELFSDFVEMAQHLLDEGYKDPAAVVVGAALESHLRQLCVKHGIETEVSSSKDPRAKKAERMNQDLAKEGVLGKGDKKSVTAWLDIRNNAAHGNFDKYSAEQVKVMIMGVRDFILRMPA
ncbi:hypothetical protein KAU37_11350 [Candidatus Bipolaricaulota bacterium]|nr:hypothetical protein [Candidatus Bipolaricaulota bacterium]